ncbi:MAG: FkbM family methyltransferase [Proteobacteria bacterium]|nr:FkbM family methyltransferase [Pseudomonadota bacterium]
MNAILQVSRYIYQHNPWYSVPFKFVQAFVYQLRKRFVQHLSTKKLFNGYKSYLFAHNPITSALVYTDIPDKTEIYALRKFADSETIFLDIGANVGLYCLFLADIVKDFYAFEAHPETAKCCKMNFALNNLNENRLIEMAVSNNNTPIYFSNKDKASPINHIVNSKEDAITVMATTLDQFVQSCDFNKETKFILKIDVEGHEYEVFEGAKAFLQHHAIKAIIFESFSVKNNEIIALLQALGFKTQPIGSNNILAFKQA